jgi:DNA-binding GntR family transcriptional regulator
MSVRHLDVKEIRDIFAVRGVLESLAARTLSDMPDKEGALAELRAAVDNMEKAAKSSLEERIESDLEFHRTLCRLSGNETLLHSWESLEGSIRMSIMFAGLERATRNMSVGRHHDIVAAIETGNAAKARETIIEHMNGAAENLVG